MLEAPPGRQDDAGTFASIRQLLTATLTQVDALLACHSYLVASQADFHLRVLRLHLWEAQDLVGRSEQAMATPDGRGAR